MGSALTRSGPLPESAERDARWFRDGTGIAYRGAVVWTQFYSNSAYREAWCPIRRSPDQRLAGAFYRPRDLLATLSPVGRDHRSEMVHPTPNRLVGHRQSAFRQQILDVAQAEGEPEIEPYCLVNDLGREPISGVADFLHDVRLRRIQSASKLPAPRQCPGARRSAPGDRAAKGRRIWRRARGRPSPRSASRLRSAAPAPATGRRCPRRRGKHT